MSVGATQPLKVYFKGEFQNFNGVAFGLYATKSECDVVIKKLRAAGLEYGGHKVWAKLGQPLEVRIRNSVLFETKKMLIQWGENGKALWVDADQQQLTYGDDTVLTVEVDNHKLQTVFGDGWESYITADNQDWNKFIKNAYEKLSRQAPPTKGVGNGTAKGRKE